jgi:small subunit ribosomal protein S7
MSRRRVVAKRETQPDPRYRDRQVGRFTNVLMRQGKKSLAERIVYEAFELIQRRANEDGLKIFKRAMDNVRPRVEVKSRRVGGATYQVPVEIRGDRSTALAMRWLIHYARSRSGRSMQERLAAELMDAANDRGEAARRREETHRMADANKAYSHYRW